VKQRQAIGDHQVKPSNLRLQVAPFINTVQPEGYNIIYVTSRL